MGFLQKLFGHKPASPTIATSAPAGDPSKDPNMIRVFDAYGREMFITKQVWRDSVLKDHIKKVWDDPNALATVIIQSLHDGFIAEMLKPAERLAVIDSDRERSATILAIVYRDLKRLDDSENVILTHFKRHGESGVLLTNLAKVQADRGQEELSLRTLWRGLELDPNQENGLGWYVVIHREKDGPAGSNAAMRRIAQLPGSWRARLWLARDALDSRRCEDALQIYDEAIAMASRPLPVELLQQISGDLGNHGHLPELLRIVAPLFDLNTHGLAVGNNLIKANLDLGRLDEARALIDRHYALQRPDWKETLAFWENEVAKARVEASNPPAPGKLSVTMAMFEGPIWLPERSPASELFPAAIGEPTRIAFLGSTVEKLEVTSEVMHQMSDNPGRMSRALPLFLAEQVRFRSQASVRSMITWVGGDRAAFAVTPVSWTTEDAAQHGRSGPVPCDYIVVTHLRQTRGLWQIELRLIRTIDGSCLGSANFSDCLEPVGTLDSFPKLAEALLELLADQAEVVRTSPPKFYQVPGASSLPNYLLRIEQLMAVRCTEIDGTPADFLNGEREILDGNLQQCLAHPVNVTVRLILLETLRRMQKPRPEVVGEFRNKVLMLQREKPLPPMAQEITQRMTAAIFP